MTASAPPRTMPLGRDSGDRRASFLEVVGLTEIETNLSARPRSAVGSTMGPSKSEARV